MGMLATAAIFLPLFFCPVKIAAPIAAEKRVSTAIKTMPPISTIAPHPVSGAAAIAIAGKRVTARVIRIRMYVHLTKDWFPIEDTEYLHAFMVGLKCIVNIHLWIGVSQFACGVGHGMRCCRMHLISRQQRKQRRNCPARCSLGRNTMVYGLLRVLCCENLPSLHLQAKQAGRKQLSIQ